ncbi:MAG TPA: ParB/RepB/Spo0J family partition protein [Gemmatimonadaceae bacterium]|nr:ParB/RepB/Spo0J family partition protein [Gemmatimonadaceae bacterium]
MTAPRSARQRDRHHNTTQIPRGADTGATRLCGIHALRVSQYQPSGRPSSHAIEAVSRAVREAGTLERLVRRENGAFDTLDHESRELAQLAADIAAHGVESPLEARETRDGIELLAGHRRLVAARLAGHTEVPVRILGALSEHEAAGFVLRRNRLRAGFSTWQEAVLLRSLQERRRAAGLGGDSVRALAQTMSYSIGRVSELLAIGRAFPPVAVRQIGGGNEARAEEALTRLSYRALRELIKVADPERRIALARQALGFIEPASTGTSATTAGQSPPFRTAARRAGGFTLSVDRPIDQLDRHDAELLLRVLMEHAESVRQRLRRA